MFSLLFCKLDDLLAQSLLVMANLLFKFMNLFLLCFSILAQLILVLIALCDLFLQLLSKKRDLLYLTLQLLIDVFCVCHLFLIVFLVLLHCITELLDFALSRIDLLFHAVDLILGFLQFSNQILVHLFVVVQFIVDVFVFELLSFVLVNDCTYILFHCFKLRFEGCIVLLEKFHDWISIDFLRFHLCKDLFTGLPLLNLTSILGVQLFQLVLLLL